MFKRKKLERDLDKVKKIDVASEVEKVRPQQPKKEKEERTDDDEETPEGLIYDKYLANETVFRSCLVKWIYEISFDLDRLVFLKEVELGIKTEDEYLEFYRQLQNR